jgi:hypothetical protein
MEGIDILDLSKGTLAGCEGGKSAQVNGYGTSGEGKEAVYAWLTGALIHGPPEESGFLQAKTGSR